MSDRSSDIDALMYAPFSCIDCGQEFESREELDALIYLLTYTSPVPSQ